MYKYDIDKRRKDRNTYPRDWNVFKKVENIGRRAKEKLAALKEIDSQR